MRWFFIGLISFIGLIIYITGVFIQNQTTKGVFFGVRTPEQFLKRDDLKKLEKDYKKRWSIVWVVSIIITNLCVIFLDAIFSPGIMIIYCLGLVIMLNFCYYKTHKKVKLIKAKEDWNEHFIYNTDDDDKNYVWGSMYCNKEDPALFVEKRIGVGWDLNWGNKKAKWFIAPIVAILIFVIIMIFYELPNTIKPRIIDINNDSIRIEGSYGEVISRNNIDKMSLEDMPKKIYKTNGASIDNKHYGNYKITYKNMSVKAKLYIENDEEKVIVIETKDGKLYLINRSNIEDTNKLYNKMK